MNMNQSVYTRSMNNTSTYADWGYQPAVNTTVSTSFQFQSTSAYVSSVRGASAGLSNRTIKRTLGGFPSSTPSDGEIGVLPAKVPVGSPLILMAFAILYIAFRQKRKKNCIFF